MSDDPKREELRAEAMKVKREALEAAASAEEQAKGAAAKMVTPEAFTDTAEKPSRRAMRTASVSNAGSLRASSPQDRSGRWTPSSIDESVVTTEQVSGSRLMVVRLPETGHGAETVHAPTRVLASVARGAYIDR